MNLGRGYSSPIRLYVVIFTGRPFGGGRAIGERVGGSVHRDRFSRAEDGPHVTGVGLRAGPV